MKVNENLSVLFLLEKSKTSLDGKAPLLHDSPLKAIAPNLVWAKNLSPFMRSRH